MNASKIQSKICEHCRLNQIPYNNLVKMSVSGWPDIMIVVYGITYFFEVKYGYDKLSEIQKYRIAQLNNHKEIAFTIKSYPEFLNILSTLL